MKFKLNVQACFLELSESKIHLLQNKLAELKESAKNETKSSAGDKHETALAILQIELKQIQQQLNEALQQKSILVAIQNTRQKDSIETGSLIKTNHGYFYLSIALGKVTLNDKSIIALSPISPLGAQFLGKKEGEHFNWNTLNVQIEEIV